MGGFWGSTPNGLLKNKKEKIIKKSNEKVTKKRGTFKEGRRKGEINEGKEESQGVVFG